MIYLASPYSSESPSMKALRFNRTVKAVALFSNEGKIVYSPIVHFHPVAIAHNLRGDFDFWKEVNLHMLQLADELYVLMLRGWKESIGVQAEIKFAEENSKPITYVMEAFLDG